MFEYEMEGTLNVDLVGDSCLYTDDKSDGSEDLKKVMEVEILDL